MLYRTANDRLNSDAGLRWTRFGKKIVGHLAYGHASRPYGGFIPAPAAGQDALSFILGAPGDYFYKVTDDALMGTAGLDRTSTRLNSRHYCASRMPPSA